jgi:hypothetical protein
MREMKFPSSGIFTEEGKNSFLAQQISQGEISSFFYSCSPLFQAMA